MSLDPSNISPARREHYRQLLASRARALLEQVRAGLRAGRATDPPGVGDEADDAHRLNEQDLRALMGQSEAARLREVEEAQARLASGTYGICEDCGQPIDPVRLDLVPEARRCARSSHAPPTARASGGSSLGPAVTRSPGPPAGAAMAES